MFPPGWNTMALSAYLREGSIKNHPSPIFPALSFLLTSPSSLPCELVGLACLDHGPEILRSHGIRVRAARIDPQKDGHVLSLSHLDFHRGRGIAICYRAKPLRDVCGARPGQAARFPRCRPHRRSHSGTDRPLRSSQSTFPCTGLSLRMR